MNPYAASKSRLAAKERYIKNENNFVHPDGFFMAETSWSWDVSKKGGFGSSQVSIFTYENPYQRSGVAVTFFVNSPS